MVGVRQGLTLEVRQGLLAPGGSSCGRRHGTRARHRQASLTDRERGPATLLGSLCSCPLAPPLAAVTPRLPGRTPGKRPGSVRV